MGVSSGRSLDQRSPLAEPRRPRRAVAVGCLAGLLMAVLDGGHWFTAAVILPMAVDLALVLNF